jgi:hypothetical protein
MPQPRAGPAWRGGAHRGARAGIRSGGRSVGQRCGVSRLFAEAMGTPAPDLAPDVLETTVWRLRSTVPPWEVTVSHLVPSGCPRSCSPVARTACTTRSRQPWLCSAPSMMSSPMPVTGHRTEPKESRSSIGSGSARRIEPHLDSTRRAGQQPLTTTARVSALTGRFRPDSSRRRSRRHGRWAVARSHGRAGLG